MRSASKKGCLCLGTEAAFVYSLFYSVHGIGNRRFIYAFPNMVGIDAILYAAYSQSRRSLGSSDSRQA